MKRILILTVIMASALSINLSASAQKNREGLQAATKKIQLQQECLS